MIDLINVAVSTGAVIYGSISGGKDGQAMANVIEPLFKNHIEGYIHADLGRMEWEESLPQCNKIAYKFAKPLHVIRRSDGLDLLSYIERRKNKLKGTGKPFWPSSSQRYCTSDTKRGPINKFFRNCPHNFIISAEGIRAAESDARKIKSPLTIRKEITSTFYRGMTVEQAIINYRDDKRLALTWYPIFNYSTSDVWNTEGLTALHLTLARDIYKKTGKVPDWWTFHPAYAYGNDRVSCKICVLGSKNDKENGIRHGQKLATVLAEWEKETNFSYTKSFSISEHLKKEQA